jgi:hypothetical protein
MQNQNLHQYRNPCAMLKYAVALAVLLLIIMGNFSARHDSSHIVKADLHCALCLSPHHLDHGLTTSALKFKLPAQNAIAVKYAVIFYPDSFKPTTGNRDPPLLSAFS